MRRARLAPVVAAVAIGSLLAGCGGGSSKHDTGTAATQSGKTQSVTGSGNPGESLETTFERVIRDVSPAVVLIQTKQGLGSGVVYDDKGDIVTNAHVVGAFKTFTVSLSGCDRHPAKLVGTDPLDDLAVIQLDSGSPKPATFGDSSKLAVGQLALAVGNPLGLRSSVTDGIISSLGGR